MKFVIFFLVPAIVFPIIISASDFATSTLPAEVNLTQWREHRRKKRFILFENAGISKLVAGITFPVDLDDKKPWRQLVLTYNIHFQFAVPARPIYWWNNWSSRNLGNRQSARSENVRDFEKYRDVAQEFMYEFAVNLMDRKGMNGKACLLRAICENAQIHRNQGLYAEILHRILQPQRNLNSDYMEAWQVGKQGIDCQAVYPQAKNCLLDEYLHVREDFMQQHFVKDSRT